MSVDFWKIFAVKVFLAVLGKSSYDSGVFCLLFYVQSRKIPKKRMLELLAKE